MSVEWNIYIGDEYVTGINVYAAETDMERTERQL